MTFLDRILSALTPKQDTSPRRYRLCSYCGKRSDEPYTDSEWNARKRMCEECEYAEMADGTLW
jgi:hypothetical protein